ncbi:hypothetical protein B0T14DRAFT_501982 [Immersiella caudata]|uniref:Uncharacterized protein n=1 Tax=Immersiella caudata TaxID=314043 RepID=A0AA40CBN1_9PEZI|nr:hypothetical protein B0T14DRAFT_501982 [Immersiella caudata]
MRAAHSQDTMQLDQDFDERQQAEKITALTYRLIRNNPHESLAQNYNKTLNDWVLLLRQTALSNNPVSASDFITAFQAVDEIICQRKGTMMLRRLAYLRLMQLFDSLHAFLKANRNSGRAVKKKLHQRDATIALDVYMSAQDPNLVGKDLRQQLSERKRLGKRWRELAIIDPLFVLVYSEDAEFIIAGFSRVDNATLKRVAARIQCLCPPDFVTFCQNAAERVRIATLDLAGSSQSLCK